MRDLSPPESKDEPNGRNSWRSNIWLIVFAVIGICICAIAVGAYALHFSKLGQVVSSNASDWGTFGDFLGGTLNPLLSLLAFLALLYTIKIQSDELKLSRIELALTRTELEGSKKALLEQNRKFERDLFLQTFFELFRDLSTQREKFMSGDSYFEGAVLKIEEYLGYATDETEYVNQINSISNQERIGDTLQRYLSLIEMIFSHISEHKSKDVTDKPEAIFASNLVTKVLLDAEVLLIFYMSFEKNFPTLYDATHRNKLFDHLKPHQFNSHYIEALRQPSKRRFYFPKEADQPGD